MELGHDEDEEEEELARQRGRGAHSKQRTQHMSKQNLESTCHGAGGAVRTARAQRSTQTKETN